VALLAREKEVDLFEFSPPSSRRGAKNFSMAERRDHFNHSGNQKKLWPGPCIPEEPQI
jgi:hypothetical protein